MEKKPNSNTQLPPGFRFHPTDEGLIVHYLRNKATSSSLPAAIIAEVDLYKCNPWELPRKALFGKEEWYFFTPRDAKYPNRVRPNRMTASGYWKATGTDKPIRSSCGTRIIGVKKALVFYRGRPPRGIKTDWNMQEYRLPEATMLTSKRKECIRLDDWVLCRVRQKNSTRNSLEDQFGSRNEPLCEEHALRFLAQALKLAKPLLQSVKAILTQTIHNTRSHLLTVRSMDIRESSPLKELNMRISSNPRSSGEESDKSLAMLELKEEINGKGFCNCSHGCNGIHKGDKIRIWPSIWRDVEQTSNRCHTHQLATGQSQDNDFPIATVNCDHSINGGIIVIRGDLQVGGIVRFGSAFHEEIKEGKRLSKGQYESK
ncbi:hypothetical protein TEA_027000 [Camellia sinensis var. sinensis]|uniref:NAC domain-containing protein n=1 Tax=Camellia sinensis var. sinensis TaxID=542762 RepID=A0A4S4EJN6_CAMSN|nr:hypothetical protein TEA_027000 [Camellia sinensis var. sinensis]